MTLWLSASCVSQVYHGNRQDVREGGVIPPLPRNCERPCPPVRLLDQDRHQPELLRACGDLYH
jgi:hypothetical protein